MSRSSLLNQLMDAFRMRANPPAAPTPSIPGPDPKEWDYFTKRAGDVVCPACRSTLFYDGPHGGSAVNVQCANPACGKWWWYGGMGQPDFKPLDEHGQWRSRVPQKMEDII